MKKKIMKKKFWVLEDTDRKGEFLSKPSSKHVYDMVKFDNPEDILFLLTREIARNFAKSFYNLTPRKVLITVE